MQRRTATIPAKIPVGKQPHCLNQEGLSYVSQDNQVLFIVTESVIEDLKVQNRQEYLTLQVQSSRCLLLGLCGEGEIQGHSRGTQGGGTSWSGDKPVCLGWKGQMKFCLFSVELGVPSRSHAGAGQSEASGRQGKEEEKPQSQRSNLDFSHWFLYLSWASQLISLSHRVCIRETERVCPDIPSARGDVRIR